MRKIDAYAVAGQLEEDLMAEALSTDSNDAEVVVYLDDESTRLLSILVTRAGFKLSTYDTTTGVEVFVGRLASYGDVVLFACAYAERARTRKK